MSQPHEEFEVLTHLDQAFRTGVTAAAQLAETRARRSAERDRVAAQRARSEALLARLTSANTPRDTVQPSVDRQAREENHREQTRQAAAWLEQYAPATGAEYARQLADVADPVYRTKVEQRMVRAAHTLAATEGVGLDAPAPASNVRQLQREAASYETVALVLPAGEANRNRGFAPSQAETLAELAHRERAWEIAREEFVTPGGRFDADRAARWDALTDQARQEHFWAVYDNEAARHVQVNIPLDAEGDPLVRPNDVAPAEVLAAAVSDAAETTSAGEREAEARRDAATEETLVQASSATVADAVTDPAHEQVAHEQVDTVDQQPGDRVSPPAAERRDTRAAGAVMIPAYRANPDRGVAPSKARSAAEAQHRRQTWALAQEQWARSQPAGAGTRKEWDELPMKVKTDLYWKVYDTPAARAIPPQTRSSERGMAPTKAPTPAEEERRRTAWREAEVQFAAENPQYTPREARTAWQELDWQDRAMRYWTAYENDPPAVDAESATDHEPAHPEANLQEADRESPHPSTAERAAEAVAEGTAVVVAGGLAAEAIEHESGRHAGEQLATTSRERVVELNRAAGEWFAQQGGPDSKGGKYLVERLGSDVLREGRWQLGYAPESWTGLTDHLRRTQNASDRELLDSGLGRMSSRNTVIDTFRDRAMIGVRDLEGNTVGFVGRDLSGHENAPKYTNTGHTPAFTKGDHLLGLYEAPHRAQLWLVEGPLDAIALTAASNGQAAGIAPMGTALSDHQADLLAERSGGKVWAALDNDPAGQAALVKDFDALSRRGVDVRAVTLPGKDPAEIWQRDPEMLRRTVEAADVWPTAGAIAVEAAADHDRERLAAGNSAAMSTYQRRVEEIANRVPEADRLEVRAVAEVALRPAGEPSSSPTVQDTRQSAEPPQRTQATVTDPEAIAARQESAHGFPHSTMDMLHASHEGSSGTAARVTRQPSMEQRRERGREL